MVEQTTEQKEEEMQITFFVENRPYISTEKEISRGRIFAIANIPDTYDLYRQGDESDLLITMSDQLHDIEGARFYALPKAAFA